MAGPEGDINKIIESAVNARVEAAVLESLASGGTMQAFVTAALSQKVTPPGGYSSDAKPLLSYLLQQTIVELTKKVVAEEIKGHEDVIRAEVRSALEKSIGVIADSLVNGFVEHATGRYPSITVSFADKS